MTPRDWTNIWAWTPPANCRSLQEWWDNSTALIEREKKRRIQAIPTASSSDMIIHKP